VRPLIGYDPPTDKDYGCKVWVKKLKNGEIKIVKEKFYPPIQRPEADGGRG